jgi:hypothetical protein
LSFARRRREERTAIVNKPAARGEAAQYQQKQDSANAAAAFRRGRHQWRVAPWAAFAGGGLIKRGRAIKRQTAGG